MAEPNEALLAAFDGHNIESVRRALDAGADAGSPYRGKPPIYWLLEEYTRSNRLPGCLRLLLERGAVLDDPLAIPVLLDDPDALRAAFKASPSILEHRTSLVSTFTSLIDVPLLHVAAEYGNQNAARTLLELGAEPDARAAVDHDGLNGHTALFHTVNSNANRSAPIMKALVDAGADCSVRLDGLVWGKGFEWETIFFDVTPISFAQFGLLPQVHRDENDIYSNIEFLMQGSRRRVPKLENVPNKYLRPKSRGQG